MTVILDCNIWISLTINSQIDFIADLSDNGIIIASCDTLKHEITSVLNRPKLAKFILPTDIDKITELHDLVATQYSPGKIKPVTKDPKDDYLFARPLNAMLTIWSQAISYCKMLIAIKKQG